MRAFTGLASSSIIGQESNRTDSPKPGRLAASPVEPTAMGAPRMSRARCTLAVKELDCPNEVAVLRASLEGQPGVEALGFDLINGLLTIDFDPTRATPDSLILRITQDARMTARRVDPAQVQERGRGRPFLVAKASPLAGDRRFWNSSGRWRGARLLRSFPPGRMARLSGRHRPWACRIAPQGTGLAAPQAARHARADDGGHLGAAGSGSGMKRRPSAFLFGLSEALEA